MPHKLDRVDPSQVFFGAVHLMMFFWWENLGLFQAIHPAPSTPLSVPAALNPAWYPMSSGGGGGAGGPGHGPVIHWGKWGPTQRPQVGDDFSNFHCHDDHQRIWCHNGNENFDDDR